MKETNNNIAFTGTILFDNEIRLFSFSDFQLKIELPDSYISKLLNSKQKLGITSLYGMIANRPNHVYFAFDESSYSTNLQSNGFLSFNIIIYIKYYFVLSRPFVRNNLVVEFKNNSFQKWLDIYPVYHYDHSFTFVDRLSVKNGSIDLKSNFTYKGKEYSIYPYGYTNFSPIHFMFDSVLRVDCLSPNGFEDLYELCCCVLNLVKYSFYRFRVDLGEITIKHTINGDDGKMYTEDVGAIYFNYDKRIFEPINLGNPCEFGFLRWADFYKCIPAFVSSIEKNNIYLFHIPETRKDRYKTGFNDISLLSAAFECEFCLSFPDFVSKKDTDNDYVNLRNSILNIQTSKKQKKILDNFIGIFFKNASLSERVGFALHHFEKVLKLFYINENETIDHIAKVFNEARNKIDHGNLNFKIDSDTATVFYYLRIIILSMQLSRMGVSIEKLPTIIKPVFDGVVQK